MADVRRLELEDLVVRPGTYFNPTTEVLIVVDDSVSIETGLLEEEGGAEWIVISDEPAVDEHRRDELVEGFETLRAGTTLPDSDDDVVEDEDELEPDPDEDL